MNKTQDVFNNLKPNTQNKPNVVFDNNFLKQLDNSNYNFNNVIVPKPVTEADKIIAEKVKKMQKK